MILIDNVLGIIYINKKLWNQISKRYLMILKFSDKIRVDYKGYMEPLLLTACEYQAKKCGTKTRSKYIRYAVIRALIQDGYPLNKITNKFDKFYTKLNQLVK